MGTTTAASIHRMLCLAVMIVFVISCTNKKDTNKPEVKKAELHLSAFGVESDSFPNIDINIDFSKDTAVCHKSYYDPAIHESYYTLGKSELDQLQQLLSTLAEPGRDTTYKVTKTDQPTATLELHTSGGTVSITDYGLEGPGPLPKIYEIVFRY